MERKRGTPSELLPERPAASHNAPNLISDGVALVGGGMRTWEFCRNAMLQSQTAILTSPALTADWSRRPPPASFVASFFRPMHSKEQLRIKRGLSLPCDSGGKNSNRLLGKKQWNLDGREKEQIGGESETILMHNHYHRS